METLHLISRFKIHDGNLAAFKAWSDECVAVTKREQPGPLYYEWFLDEPNSECVVREGFKDSNALMVHMGNLGELLGKGMAMADFKPEVYGTPSDELKAAAAALAPLIYTRFNGF